MRWWCVYRVSWKVKNLSGTCRSHGNNPTNIHKMYWNFLFRCICLTFLSVVSREFRFFLWEDTSVHSEVFNESSKIVCLYSFTISRNSGFSFYFYTIRNDRSWFLSAIVYNAHVILISRESGCRCEGFTSIGVLQHRDCCHYIMHLLKNLLEGRQYLDET